MLALRRGTVVDAGEPAPMQRLTVEVDGEPRPALADTALVGVARRGDDVVVNTIAVELGLGSGGYDLLHVNLTRGLDAGPGSDHVLKLNYTSLQHAVAPVDGDPAAVRGRPVAVGLLHGQLAPLAFGYARPGLGYVQTEGGALPGALSDVVRELRERGLLAGHLTAGQSYGGADGDAISLAGALAHGFGALGWSAAVCAPGPGIVGSGTELGHGAMHALDALHAAAALGARVVLAPRRSDSDPRERQRGTSHHTRTVLELALAAVEVPAEDAEADLEGYLASGLPALNMGREDPAFFRAALAAGALLAAV